MLSTLAVMLVVLSAGTALAQQRADVASEAIEMWTWFEIPSPGESLETALGPILTRRNVSAGGAAEEGFLPVVPYSATQLTQNARNIGSPGTLKVWAQLSCNPRADLDAQASLRGKLTFKVWVEDPATGFLQLLAKLRARADGGSVFDERKADVADLREGNRLWFQLARDRVSPLRDVYCSFGFGIYREFLGD